MFPNLFLRALHSMVATVCDWPSGLMVDSCTPWQHKCALMYGVSGTSPHLTILPLKSSVTIGVHVVDMVMEGGHSDGLGVVFGWR